jgi:hypothetical protein
MLALSAAEGTILVSAGGGVVLAVLIAFGLWWFKPFRSVSRRDLRTFESDGESDRREEPGS